jgi:hypothetical protein
MTKGLIVTNTQDSQNCDDNQPELQQYVRYGDILQIDPSRDQVFGGCFMIVEKVLEEEVQGYIPIPKKTRWEMGHFEKPSSLVCYLRKKWADVRLVGKSIWRNSITSDDRKVSMDFNSKISDNIEKYKVI